MNMTMQELLDDDDFRVETGDYYKSASTRMKRLMIY